MLLLEHIRHNTFQLIELRDDFFELVQALDCIIPYGEKLVTDMVSILERNGIWFIYLQACSDATDIILKLRDDRR